MKPRKKAKARKLTRQDAPERHEVELLMLDAVCHALESAERQCVESRWASLELRARELDEREKVECLISDLQLIQTGCTRELGGSVWIRGEMLAEALRRYSEGK